MSFWSLFEAIESIKIMDPITAASLVISALLQDDCFICNLANKRRCPLGGGHDKCVL